MYVGKIIKNHNFSCKCHKKNPYFWQFFFGIKQKKRKKNLCFANVSPDLIGPRLYNGPMNLGLSTFYHIIFLRIGSLFFLYLTWCWGAIRTQNWQSQFFGGGILAWPKVNQKVQNHPICPFVCYYRIFLRVGSLAFFIFCMKLRDHKYSKLTGLIFLGKFSFAWKAGQKGPNWPDLCSHPLLPIFLRIGSLVLIFCMKWRDHK